MSIESRSRQYGKVFDHWQIKEFLGSGSGGKTAVFRLQRSDSSWGACALKIVNLIEERGNVETLSDFRRREYEAARAECSRSAEQEVRLMDELRGNTNIVDYLDHTFVDWSDESGFGRDLLIRMELLEDLRSDLKNGRMFSQEEVLKIGRDICAALMLCHKKNILHRDVKPENIFRNKDGNYKLGDFGVSRVLDACPGAVASTGIGTYEYWPAEQMTGRYDKRVDLYSLGLVLYELSNGNRLPFAASTYATGKEVSLRLAGSALPTPSEAGPILAKVILKATAFKPEDRYQSAEEMLKALDWVGRKEKAPIEVSREFPTKADFGDDATVLAKELGLPETFFFDETHKAVSASADHFFPLPPSSTGPVRKEYSPNNVKNESTREERNFFRIFRIAICSVACLGVIGFACVRTGVFNRDDADHEAVLQNEFVVNDSQTFAQSPPFETIPEKPILSETTSSELALLPETTLPSEDAISQVKTDQFAPTEIVTEEVLAETEVPLNHNKVVKVSVGSFHVVALYEDGTVDAVSVEKSVLKQHPSWPVWEASGISAWRNIVDISADYQHIVGLKSDGTVVATGTNWYGECDTSDWSDIVAIATGLYATVGLKTDGTLVQTGSTASIGDVSGLVDVKAISMGQGSLEYLQSDGSWRKHSADGGDEVYGVYPDLVSIYSDSWNSIGIKKDGSIIVARTKNLNRSWVSDWENIIAVSASYSHILGLKSDGTVCAAGNNQLFQCNVSHWTDIEKVTADGNFSIGIKSDGTIQFAGDREKYDIGALNREESVTKGAAGIVAHTDSGVNVRSGPGTDYYQVTKLPHGSSVVILEEKTDKNGTVWGRTMYGWISMNYVDLK